MFFGLTNSPATFQAMMNERFKDLIAEGVVVVYMDDILIFTKTLEEHHQVVQRVLQILTNNDLYLKPEKCLFEQESIEFLGLIILHDHVGMDPVKVDGILAWPAPHNVKEVQSFVGFCNFYRRFIKDFSNTAQPLHNLTTKDKVWEWSDACQTVFDTLKQQFASSPILVIPDPTKPYCIECNASDYATGAILSQQSGDNLWHPVAYLLKAMTTAERNYDIHDKELLAVVHAFDTWRHYLEGTTHSIDIFSDHSNLTYFTEAQKLNRRQARWSILLTRFEFRILHKPGRYNHADPLSRRADHRRQSNTDQERHALLVNQPLHIDAASTTSIDSIKNTIRDLTINDTFAKSLATLLASNSMQVKNRLKAWTQRNRVWFHHDRIYVPDNDDLRRSITHLCHDTIATGHPGRYRTQELMARDFTWPGMSRFIKSYIEGCAICQANKINAHPSTAPVLPNNIPTRPFQVMTTDFIVDLPECEGFTSIAVYVDRGYKMVYLAPTVKTIDSLGSSDLFMRYVFPHTGLMEQLISDRGQQYASQTARHIFKTLGIKSSLSTAYHPQTDGQTERFNQELEQYLRIFCSYRQDDWVKLLPIAQFVHNSQVSSATGKSPFDLLYGFTPRSYPAIASTSSWPTVDKRLSQLHDARLEAQAALRLTADIMRNTADTGAIPTTTFNIGDRVWLEGKNLKTTQPKAKLSAKRFGPFTVTDVLGPVTYRLAIPPKWRNARIHPVFHVSLLTRYIETPAHGPNFTEPPPDVTNTENAADGHYEIDAILDGRPTSNNRGFQYLAKWLGYSDAENQWLTQSKLSDAWEAVAEYHTANPTAPMPSNYQRWIDKHQTEGGP
jgi:hypothetical protein